MRLLTLLRFVSTMLLSLEPTVQAKKLSEHLYNAEVPVPSRLVAVSSPRTIRNVPEQQDDSNTTRGFLVEYTLMTANSPDCEPSLVDNFPVRVQYRLITPAEVNLDGSTVTEWRYSPNTPVFMQGENCLFMYVVLDLVIPFQRYHN